MSRTADRQKCVQKVYTESEKSQFIKGNMSLGNGCMSQRHFGRCLGVCVCACVFVSVCLSPSYECVTWLDRTWDGRRNVGAVQADITQRRNVNTICVTTRTYTHLQGTANHYLRSSPSHFIIPLSPQSFSQGPSRFHPSDHLTQRWIKRPQWQANTMRARWDMGHSRECGESTGKTLF